MNHTDHVKLESHQHEVGSLFLDQDPTFAFGAWDFQHYLFEFDTFVYPQMMSTTSQVDQFNDFEDIAGDLCLWNFDQKPISNDAKSSNYPLTNNPDAINGDKQGEDICTNRVCNDSNLAPTHCTNLSMINKDNTSSQDVVSRNGKRKSCALRLEDIQKYFHVPIAQAAKELDVGLTVLKKRCRELNIMRWPHRKIKSLQSLIHNVKELGMKSEVKMLEENKKLVERIPQMELTERAKKLRQTCFKANYKKRRTNLLPNGDSSS